MKIIKTIRDADFGFTKSFPETYTTRSAARAVVLDNDGKIALLHATKLDYHKLPGGGIEEGEDVLAALAREIQEEIGCVATNLKEVGSIEEYRSEYALLQTSHCFLADLKGEKGEPNLTEDEIEEGFKTVWMDISSAIDTLDKEMAKVSHYEGKFMVARDNAFLKAAKMILDAS